MEDGSKRPTGIREDRDSAQRHTGPSRIVVAMNERVEVVGDWHLLSTCSAESCPQGGPLLDQLERESIGKGQARPCVRGEFREGKAVQRTWSRWLDGRVVVPKDLLPGQIQAVRPAPIQTLSKGTASQNYSQVSSERAH